jgi:hypothetical protein
MNAEATTVRGSKAIGTGLSRGWAGPPSDAAIRAVVRLGLVPMCLLRTSFGRRLTAALVLSLLLVGMVSALYDHADGPARSGQANAAATTAAARPAAGKASAAKSAGASRDTTLAAVAVTRAAKDPQTAAVTWYASRLHVSPKRVQALQQQRVDGTTTKILVMAQVSQTNVPTALVTVKRAGGGWKVP